MLRQNPKGGRPLKGLGSIDWDETYGGFQYKLGYCKCGEKVLATGDEMGEIVKEFAYLGTGRRKLIKTVAISLLRRLA